mmetsp:Transcript_13591/g.28943  ORF Transcript_13591/g.28943 Transcript_13591/m.28943 type:complete len:627 (+) Transcript_13591:3602-5482(+)
MARDVRRRRRAGGRHGHREAHLELAAVAHRLDALRVPVRVDGRGRRRGGGGVERVDARRAQVGVGHRGEQVPGQLLRLRQRRLALPHRVRDLRDVRREGVDVRVRLVDEPLEVGDVPLGTGDAVAEGEEQPLLEGARAIQAALQLRGQPVELLLEHLLPRGEHRQGGADLPLHGEGRVHRRRRRRHAPRGARLGPAGHPHARLRRRLLQEGAQPAGARLGQRPQDELPRVLQQAAPSGGLRLELSLLALEQRARAPLHPQGVEVVGGHAHAHVVVDDDDEDGAAGGRVVALAGHHGGEVDVGHRHRHHRELEAVVEQVGDAELDGVCGGPVGVGELARVKHHAGPGLPAGRRHQHRLRAHRHLLHDVRAQERLPDVPGQVGGVVPEPVDPRDACPPHCGEGGARAERAEALLVLLYEQRGLDVAVHRVLRTHHPGLRLERVAARVVLLVREHHRLRHQGDHGGVQVRPARRQEGVALAAVQLRAGAVRAEVEALLARVDDGDAAHGAGVEPREGAVEHQELHLEGGADGGVLVEAPLQALEAELVPGAPDAQAARRGAAEHARGEVALLAVRGNGARLAQELRRRRLVALALAVRRELLELDVGRDELRPHEGGVQLQGEGDHRLR